MTETQNRFDINRIFNKDISFESPNPVEFFKQKHSFAANVAVDVKAQVVSESLHEVVLTIQVTAKLQDKETVAYVIEVSEAGLFTVEGYTEEQCNHILYTVCPNILLPYARETISSLVVKGGFPALYLAPINFDALYAAQQKREAETKSETTDR